MRDSYLVAILSVATLAIALDDSSLKVSTRCPEIDPTDTTIYIAHETDCTKFYMCLAGRKIEKNCPIVDKQGTKLHFNSVLQVCDWQYRTSCLNSNKSTFTETKITTTVTPMLTTDISITTTEIKSVPKQSINLCRYLESVEPIASITTLAPINQMLFQINKCSGVDDGTNLPCDNDCKCYYTCCKGHMYLQKCHKGLHFNARLGVCDFPENAKCDDSKQPTDPPTERPETTDPPTESPDPTDLPTESTETPKPKDKCFGKPDETRLPHESNCTLYYKCEHGQQVPYRCQKGLHFDAKRQICDLPENANCDPKKPPTDPPTERPETTDPPTESPDPTDIPTESTETPKPKDKCFDKPEETRLPHESNCTRYYKCIHGQQVLYRCQRGLHFDAERQICDLPENANCEPKKPPTDPPTERPETTDPPTKSPDPTDIPTESTETPKPKDKCFDKPEETRLPHESNCTRYYKCVHGQQVLYRCQRGLHFDAERQICDLPENANCDSKTPPTEATPTPKPDCDPNGIYQIPHETDCKSYYICFLGEKILHKCPGDLLFHPIEKKCDKPERVSCSVCDPNSIYKIPDETDCKFYYVCWFGEKIRMKCIFDRLFNPISKTCDSPEKVSCKKRKEKEKRENESLESVHKKTNDKHKTRSSFWSKLPFFGAYF